MKHGISPRWQEYTNGQYSVVNGRETGKEKGRRRGGERMLAILSTMYTARPLYTFSLNKPSVHMHSFLISAVNYINGFITDFTLP